MTLRERNIRKKYTRIRKFPNGETALFLCIDQQEFEIISGGNQRWFRDMLAIALTRMIENEVKQ
jgi:hypothetical protein